MRNNFLDEALNALTGEDWDERPVEIEEFVTSEDFLNLPPLSNYQYSMIKAGSQIYKRETLLALYGEERGEERYRQTCSEVIMALGKGSCSLQTDLYDANTGRWVQFKDMMSNDNCVATINRRDRKISSGYATEVFHSVTEPAYNVTTSKGFSFRVNAGHRFVAKGFVMKPLFELSLGDRIAVPTVLPVRNEVEIDEREIKLLGYWLGAGVRLDKRIINIDFSDNDSNALSEYVAIHKSYGDNPTVIRHLTKGGWLVRSGLRSCPSVLEVATKHGMRDKRVHNKIIPDAIWSLPIHQLSIFISRLWGAGGCSYLKKCEDGATRPTLEYYSVSENLIVDVQRLLARLGIISGLRKAQRPGWYLTISDGPGFLRFHESVTMLDKDTSSTADIVSSSMDSYSSEYEADVYWDSIKSIEGVGTEELFTVTATDYENYVADMVLNGNSGK